MAIAWKRKWLIVCCIVFSVGLGGAYVFQAVPQYEVEARLLVEQRAVPNDPSRVSRRRDDELVMTQAQIIGSPAVFDTALVGSRVETQEESDRVLAVLKRFKASPVPGANVIQLSYLGESESESINTVRSIIASYRKYVRETHRDLYRETLKQLTGSEKELRDELVRLEDGYQQIREKGVSLGQGQNAINIQRSVLSDLASQIVQVRNRKIELTNKLDGILAASQGLSPRLDRAVSSADEPNRETLAFAVPDPKNVQGELTRSDADRQMTSFTTQAERVLSEMGNDLRDIRRELMEAKAADAKLAQIYETVHPDRAALKEQIGQLEDLLQQKRSEAPAILRGELAVVDKQEAQLVSLYDAEWDKAKSAEITTIKEQQAAERIQRVQESHATILEQLRQFQLADKALNQGESGLHISQLQEPVLVNSGISPPPKLLFPACALFGIMGGYALAMLLERSRNAACSDS